MPVYLLNDDPVFPPADKAEPDGLLAVGGDLSVPRLLNAYSQGIFPWFEIKELFYWYSPDPRLVLSPEKLKISSSLKRTLKSENIEVRVDTAFRRVISSCSKAKRPNEDGTWISGKFIDGYCDLHKSGYAHSFETFYKNELVGGLYGVSLGSAFFGESMFHTMADASKVAFFYLTEFAKKNQFSFIDCQMETDHLIRMGAEPVFRVDYLKMLYVAMKQPTVKGKWRMAIENPLRVGMK